MNPSSFYGGPVIVTGAARGIGLAIARRAALDKIPVALLDIESEELENATREICDNGGLAISITTDVSDYYQVQTAFETVRNKFGVPRVLVNNAGIYKSGHFSKVTAQDWEKIIAVNLTGTFFCSQAAARIMSGRGPGAIINIASIGGKIGWPRNHAYCASKAGVLGLTRVFALDLASDMITVNAVCPGNTDTNMMKQVDADIAALDNLKEGEFTKAQAARIPLGRLGKPDDVASLVRFLASSEACHITGQAINVDGGLVMF